MKKVIGIVGVAVLAVTLFLNSNAVIESDANCYKDIAGPDLLEGKVQDCVTAYQTSTCHEQSCPDAIGCYSTEI